jgi:hypothetical protein
MRMTMHANAGSSNPKAVRARSLTRPGSLMRPGSLTRLLRRVGAACGILIGIGYDAPAAHAQTADFRSADTAPASWQDFAKGLQGRFAQRLAADDNDARKLADDLAKRDAGPDAPPLTFVARTWISAAGKVERLEFDGLGDEKIALELRGLLTRDNVGAPPPDMLQPLRLRLSLRPQEQPAGNK